MDYDKYAYNMPEPAAAVQQPKPSDFWWNQLSMMQSSITNQSVHLSEQDVEINKLLSELSKLLVSRDYFSLNGYMRVYACRDEESGESVQHTAHESVQCYGKFLGFGPVSYSGEVQHEPISGGGCLTYLQESVCLVICCVINYIVNNFEKCLIR